MKGKSTKSALLMSFTSLLLCFAMLVGTTFAWFTDSVTSGVNTIKAGNLDIEVSYNDNGTWKSIQDVDSLFSKGLWEPGHTEYVTLKIENRGTLALTYRMLVSPVSEKGGINKDGYSFKLSDYLMFGTTQPSTTEPNYTSRAEARNAVTTVSTGLNLIDYNQKGDMNANDPAQYVTLVIYMPEEVGNDANYLTGTEAAEIELGITVLATQLTYEKDSFGEQYDAGAKTEDFTGVGPVYDYVNRISQTVPVAKDTNGNVTATTIEAKGLLNNVLTQLATVTVPAAAIPAGTTELTVTVDPTDATNAAALQVIANATAQGREAINYAITVNGITPDAADIDVSLFVGKGLSEVKIHHNGVLIPDSAYNPTTGFVSFETRSFSDYTVTYAQSVAYIGTQTYGSVANAVAAANAGDTIYLLKDIDVGATGMEITAAKEVIINGNGKKISGTAQYVWTIDQSVGAVTVKNVTVEGTGETNKAAINLTGCSSIVLEDVKAAGVKAGVIVNNSVATIKGNGTEIANGAWYAVDVDSGATGNAQSPMLTVEGGKVGTILFERAGSGAITGGNIAMVAGAENHNGTVAISGGVFDNAIPGGFVAEHYEAYEDGGKYKIREVFDQWDGKVPETQPDTLKYENKAWNVYDAKALAYLATQDLASASVVLKNNIDLQGNTIAPITVSGDGASFYGNGYAIKNGSVNGASLFKIAQVGDKNVNFYNIKLDNITVTNTTTSGNVWDYATAILISYTSGVVNKIEVTNCTVNGGKYTGAIVGSYEEGACLSECKVDCCTINGSEKVGGIVGFNQAGTDSQITDSKVSNTTITATKADAVSGVVGRANANAGRKATITGCSSENMKFIIAGTETAAEKRFGDSSSIPYSVAFLLNSSGTYVTD